MGRSSAILWAGRWSRCGGRVWVDLQQCLTNRFAASERECRGEVGVARCNNKDKDEIQDLSTAQRTIRPSVATTPASKCTRWGPGCSGRDDVCFGLGGRKQATT